jgi:hypothetical protein
MNKNKIKLLSKPTDAFPIRQVNFHLPESEYLLLRKNAEAAGMSYSVYIRHLNMEGKVIARLNEEDKALFRELVAMSNELHQLWKIARDQGVEQAMACFEAGRDAVDKILNTLNHDRQKLSTRKVFPSPEQVSAPGSDQGRVPLSGRGPGTRLPADGPGFRDDPSITSREDPPGLPFGTGFPP